MCHLVFTIFGCLSLLSFFKGKSIAELCLDRTFQLAVYARAQCFLLLEAFANEKMLIRQHQQGGENKKLGDNNRVEKIRIEWHPLGWRGY